MKSTTVGTSAPIQKYSSNKKVEDKEALEFLSSLQSSSGSKKKKKEKKSKEEKMKIE